MTKPDIDISRATSFAGKVAKEAGAILKQGINKRLRIAYKGKIDPVTEYDIKADTYIQSRIAKAYREHSILSEESAGAEEASPYRWVVDPLDGTVNYAHRIPIYAVSIALQYAGQTIAGAVYDPEREELFSAGLDSGAQMNGRKIRVSKEKKLDRSLLTTGFAYDVRTAKKNNLGMFARMVKIAQAVRRCGSAALDMSWLACGRFDGMWEYKLHPWDTAAGILIVEEAGGRVTRIDGSPFSIFDKDVLVSNGHIHRQIQSVLQATKRKTNKR